MDVQRGSKTLLHIPEDMYFFLHSKYRFEEHTRYLTHSNNMRYLTDRIDFFNKELTITFTEDRHRLYRKETDFSTFRIFSSISLGAYEAADKHSSNVWQHPLYEIKSVGSFKDYEIAELVDEKTFGITCSRREELDPRDIQYEICTFLDSILKGMISNGMYQEKITTVNRM